MRHPDTHKQTYCFSNRLGVPSGKLIGKRESHILTIEPDVQINQRYLVVRAIGEGGMGLVYLVRDRMRDDRPIALKVLRGNLLDREAIERFRGEFRSLARLRHPNLAEVFDFGEIAGDGRHFLTMELVDGRDLAAVERPVSTDLFDDLAVQCLRALDYIHLRGLLHNDIKPHNILIQSPSVAKIVDFGLAQGLADQGDRGLSGTLHYIAPERLRAEVPDARSDLYSLGVVLYELLTGTQPFPGDSAGQVIAAILAGRPARPRALNPGVPERLDQFVMALLAPDREARPQTASDALDLLNRGRLAPLPLETPETCASLVASGQLIGRDRDLETLFGIASDFVRAPRDDERGLRAVFVGGPSGIGKSRLLRELKHRLQLADIRTLGGRCYEDLGRPLQPFIEVLRQLPQHDDMPADMRAVLDSLLGSRAEGPPGPDVPPIADRLGKAAFLSVLASALERLAPATSGVLLLEDLHWADASTIDLLAHLLKRTRPLPWLVVATCRDDETAAAPLGDLLERFPASPRLRRLALGALDAEQIADLVTSMMPFEERPVRLARLLAERTDGNPLYLEELMRAMVEDGALFRRGPSWRIDDERLDAARLPASLAAAVSRRIAALPEEARAVAEVLAVFNRPVSPDLLSTVVPAGTEPLEVLIRLRVATIAVRAGGSRLADLAHSRIRDAIYGGVTGERRRALHLAAGRALEETHRADLDEVVEELAHHFLSAGEREAAAHYLLRAAARAEALFNFRRQAEHLDRAIDLLPAGDPRRFGALKALSQTMAQNLADPHGSLRLGRQLQDEARRAGDRRQTAEGLLREAWILGYQEESGPAIAAGRQAVDLARATGDSLILARSLNVLGTLHARLNDHRTAQEYYEEGLTLAESTDSPGLRALLAVNAGMSHMGLGQPDRARAFVERGLAISRDKGLDYHYYRNLPNYGVVLLENGELLAAIRSMEEAFTWGREHDSEMALALQFSGLGQLYAQRGLFDRALQNLERERSVREKNRDEGQLPQILDFIGAARRELGRYADAIAIHEEGLRIARSLSSKAQEGYLLAGLALDLAATEDFDRARECAQQALEIGRSIDHARIIGLGLVGQAEAALRCGKEEEIAAALPPLRAADRQPLRYPDRLLLGWTIGRCALALGGTEEAECEARAGIEASEPGGFRENHWKFQALLGESLAARGLSGEAAGAYNAAQALIREVASEIEEENVRHDYEQDPRRQDVARKAEVTIQAAADQEAADERPAAANATGSAALTGTAALTDTTAQAPVRMLATIYEISQMISSILDLKELLSKVMDLAIDIVRAERGLIFLYRSETDEMEMMVARNLEKQTIKDATEYSRGILKEVGRGRAILSHDAAADSRFRTYKSVALFHIRSLLCVPLKIRDRILGTVYVDTRQPGVIFGEEDLKFLEAFASQAAIAIENARLYEQVRQENQYLRRAVQERYGFENIIGRSARMREVFDLIARVAPSQLPVLIRGESGTGKELVARAIHHNSPRRDRRYFSENCAALPETLLESELFGHVKGAFTGAEVSRKGLFELADGGTLFLDEVGDMSLPLQSKLLRVLQDGQIRPVGSETTRQVDVRVISATNRDLEALIKEKKFREDLYFRLNVVPLRIPPLSDRREDIPLLVDHFLGKVAKENNTRKLRIDPPVMALLTRYAWPGNVRELENAVYKLALFASSDTITVRDARADIEFFGRVTRGISPGDLEGDLASLKALPALGPQEIERALAQARGNREEAARILGISRATFFRRLKEFKITEARPKPARRSPET